MHCIMYCMHAVASVMFDSLWPNGLLLTSLLPLWNSPGKSTGMGFHFLLQGIFLTQGLNPCHLHLLNWQVVFFFFFFFTTSATWEAHIMYHMTLNCVIPIIYLLQTECLGPQIHMLKSNTQCNDFWRWGLWGVMRLWEQNPPEWDYCPYKIDPTKIPQPSSM